LVMLGYLRTLIDMQSALNVTARMG
jgi:hypothetical protein